MKRYDFTVKNMHALLAQLIADGHGDSLVVVQSGMLNGSMICPVESIGTGALIPSDDTSGWGARDTIDENGSGFVFVTTSDMLPVGFWHSQKQIAPQGEESAQ